MFRDKEPLKAYTVTQTVTDHMEFHNTEVIVLLAYTHKSLFRYT